MPSKKNNYTESKNDQCKIFYQYQTIGVEKFPLTNIEKNQLCFRCPTEFNDPFDCLGDIVYSGVKDDFSRFLPPLEKYKLNDDNYLADPSIFSQNKPNSEPKDLRKRLRVCCFSESDKSILLWSHYADYHRGICFGFEGKYLGSYGKKYGLAHNRKHYSFELETKGLLKPFLHEVIYQPAFPKQINMVAAKTPITHISTPSS